MKTDEVKSDDRLLKVGIFGTIFAALCCFTPILVLLVVGVGLSAIVGWLDFALFPLLFASLGVVAQALWLQAGKPGRSPKNLVILLAALLSVLLIWLQFRFALPVSAAAALGIVLYGYWLQRKRTEIDVSP